MRESPVNRLETAWPPNPPAHDLISDERSSWSDAARSWEETLETFVTDHPRLSLGVAVTCGLVLGWMVKRK